MAHDYFRALRDVALVINSSLEPREVLHKITEQTAVTMGCKASTIRLLDSTGRFLLPSAAHGLSSTYMRKGPVEVKRSGLDGEVLSGHFTGDVTAKRRIVVYSSGVLEGQVVTPNLLTEEGGIIEGQISMKAPVKPKA